MILRPVSPASPIGPPVTKRPVGLTCMTGSWWRSSVGIVDRMTASTISLRSRSARTSGSCWADTTTVLTRFGTPRSYSIVTWVLPSGRRNGSWPDLRASARRRAMRCASAMGSGMSSGVSRQANPNIIPWSPAPSSWAAASSRTSSAALTPIAMSGDWPFTETSVPDDLLEVDVRLRRDLTEHHHEAGRRGRLARDARVRVVTDDRVEDGVTDLVAHLVRVAFGDRFGREQVVRGVEDAHAGLRGDA